jgi:hypothetical protein
MFKELLNESQAAERDATKILDAGEKFVKILSRNASRYKGEDFAVSCKEALEYAKKAMEALTDIEMEAELI